MKVDNFVSNRLKNYIWYISVTTRPPQVCILGYAPVHCKERREVSLLCEASLTHSPSLQERLDPELFTSGSLSPIAFDSKLFA